MNPKPYTDSDRSNRLWWYLLLITLLSAFCFITLDVWLLPCSIAYHETGTMTAGYLLYAAIGLLFSTPTPFIAVLIISLFIEKIGIRQMFLNIFRTEEKLKTVLITGGFCLLALLYAVLCGTPNGSPWYMLPLGFLIMVPFVGIAEETGWRGLLQPEMDKRMPYPFSVLVTAAIWFAWHLPIWIDPTSNHYGDSVVGFGITILIWAFAMAAIYRATKSVIACAIYHAFIDSIGAVYDWNALFDAFPGSVAMNAFRVLWLAAAVVLWLVATKQQKKDALTYFGSRAIADVIRWVAGIIALRWDVGIVRWVAGIIRWADSMEAMLAVSVAALAAVAIPWVAEPAEAGGNGKALSV